MSVEAELLKATKIKAKDHDERQDLLAAVVRAVSKVDQDAFDDLSDEAAEWHTAAVHAMNKKKPIPEFPAESEDDAEAETDDDTAGDGDEASAEADDGDSEDDDSATDDTDGDDTSDDTDHEAEEAEAAAKAKPKSKAKPAKAKAEPASKEKPKAAKKGGAAKAAEAEDEGEEEAPAKPKKKAKAEVDYQELSGERDRFGSVKGTKTSRALEMYEKGTTAAELQDELGGRYYNILTKMKQDGHKVEKVGEKWKLTHKDDVAKAKPKAKK